MNKAKVWLLVVVGGGAILFLAHSHPDFTAHVLGKSGQVVSNLWASASSYLHPAGQADAGATAAPSEALIPFAPISFPLAQSIVEVYMRSHASPQCTLSFLGWSNFSSVAPATAITALYRVQQPLQKDVVASVRFKIQAGAVVDAARVDPTPPTAPALIARRTIAPAFATQVSDRFSSAIFAAEHGPSMSLGLNDAFSLAQLEQAKAKAQSERKPLGFLMVWGQFFGPESDPRGKDSVSALVHFYEVFNSKLVLVFVRHESELGIVPEAVGKGFRGPNEGGYAPNMAVVDASATEFITEIPYRDLDGAGREPLFAAGGREIDQWLATHPAAMATPAAENH